MINLSIRMGLRNRVFTEFVAGTEFFVKNPVSRSRKI